MDSFEFSAGLLLAGEAPCSKQLELFLPSAAKQKLYWVAADGGCQLAKDYQVNLEAIIGDFDSTPVDHSLFQSPNINTQCLYFPTNKDESDRNLALEYLTQQGHHNIIQVGGGGKRSDHFLAMIYDYQFQRYPVLPKLWLTHYEAIFYLEAGEQIELNWPRQTNAASPINQSNDHLGKCNSQPLLLSVFPLSIESRLYSEQLKWPLHSLPKTNLPYSLSNWATTHTAQISIEQGSALVILPYPTTIDSEQNYLPAPLTEQNSTNTQKYTWEHSPIFTIRK